VYSEFINKLVMLPYVFRFNRRNSCNIGKKFMRIAQQVNSSTKTTYKEIIGGFSPYCLLAN